MRYKIDCCNGCKERTKDCHAICKKYETQKKEHDETKAEMRKKYEVEQGVIYENIVNMMKIKQKKRRQV